MLEGADTAKEHGQALLPPDLSSLGAPVVLEIDLDSQQVAAWYERHL